MSVTLKIDGLYVDDAFTHKETEYILGSDPSLSNEIDRHTSKTDAEKYEYTFKDVIISRRDTLYYMIIVRVEDSDGNVYDITSGITNHSVFGQVVSNRSVIKTPRLEILRDTFLGGEQITVNLDDFKTFDDSVEIKSVSWKVRDIFGNTILDRANDTQNLNTIVLPNNVIKNQNIVVFEAVINSETTNSFSGRKVFVRETEERFISLVSEPILKRHVDNLVSFRTNTLTTGLVVVNVRNHKNGDLIFNYTGESIEYMFDQFEIIVHSGIIEPSELYEMGVTSTLITGKTVTNTFMFKGEDKEDFYELFDVYYTKFMLNIIKYSGYDLPRYNTFTKEHTTGLVPIVVPTDVLFYDLNDNIMNEVFKYNLGGFYDIIESNVEILDGSFIIHIVTNNDEGEKDLRVIKIDFDSTGNYTKSLDDTVVPYGDNYINSGLNLYKTTLEFIYAKPGESFKRCSLTTDSSDITEESDFITDLDEYRDRIDVDDYILITGIRQRDTNTLICYANGLITIIDRETDEVRKIALDDVDHEKVKLFRTDNDNIVLITYGDTLNHRFNILEFDAENDILLRSINTDLNFNYCNIFTTLDNKFNIAEVVTNGGHKLYELQ